MASSTAYRPDIDGLRAVAVLSVIFFHLGYHTIAGGYAGVDVFFVISGYLITQQILEKQAAGAFSLFEFWKRRVRRIVPALSCMLLFVALAADALFTPEQRTTLNAQVFAASFSYSNFHFWQMANDYWGPVAESAPLLHTWSLAVEEQFYLFYPLLVLGLACLPGGQKTAMTGMALIAIASLALYYQGVGSIPGATFYLLPARAWELATGCLVAFAVRQGVSETYARWSGWLANLGLMAVVYSFFYFSAASNRLCWLVYPVLGSALVIASQRPSLAQRILSLPPLVWVGKWSYSLYLWHWPLIIFGKQFEWDDDQLRFTILVLALTFLFGITSYWLIEQPFRKSQTDWRWALSCLVLVLALAVPFGLRQQQWWAVIRGRTAMSEDERERHYAEYDHMYSRAEDYDGGPMDPSGYVPANIDNHPRPESTINAYKHGGVIKQHGADTPQLVVFGDSFGNMWAPLIDDICREMKVTVAFFTFGNNPVFFDVNDPQRPQSVRFTPSERVELDNARRKYLELWKPQAVVFCPRWSLVAKFPAPVEPFVSFVHAQGSRILFFEAPPVVELETSWCVLLELLDQGKFARPFVTQYFNRLHEDNDPKCQEMLRQLGEKYERCSMVKLADLYLAPDGEQVRVAIGRRVLYYDSTHLTIDGAELAKLRIAEHLQQALMQE